MKKSKLVCSIAVMTAIFLLTACQKDSTIEPLNEWAGLSHSGEVTLDQGLIPASSLQAPGLREIPFKANFFTRIVPEMLGEVTCKDPSLSAPNYQAGGGTATHLGKFRTVLTFCSGEGGVYGGGTGYLKAANGDRLYVCISMGQVIVPLPEPDPVYDAYFQDPFEFCGGTGRFEGASGGGMTNSFVDLWNEEYPFPGPLIPNHRTDHEWTGTLILPNGNSPH